MSVDKINVDKRIADVGIVTVDTEGAYDNAVLDKKAFILLRRNGLGGSDSSVFLNVNPYKTIEDLIEDKCMTHVTPMELAVGEKVNVRKGSDLEPLILQKFSDWSGEEVFKPHTMFRFKDPSCLTINFDGVVFKEDVQFPVEAKYVSTFADKYWDPGKALAHYCAPSSPILPGGPLHHHILTAAQMYGIPPYYYTQIQQEMMGLKAPYGYLAALFDRDWTLRVYRIYKDDCVQAAIKMEGSDVWKVIQKKKGSV